MSAQKREDDRDSPHSTGAGSANEARHRLKAVVERADEHLAHQARKEAVHDETDKAVEARHSRKAESLDQRIQRLERRIAERGAAFAVRAGSVNGKVRKSLSSPLLILVAAGAGFVFAQFKKRRKPDREDRRERIVAKPSIFASITDALTLATTLLAMMPLIRRKAEQGAQDAQAETPPES